MSENLCLEVSLRESEPWIDGKPIIPEISDEKLAELLGKLTPLYKSEMGEKLFRIAQPNPRTEAFTWGPELREEVTDFQEVARIVTEHACGYHAFFKPSLAEVLGRVPDYFAGVSTRRCTAFYIDLSTLQTFRSGSGHRVQTVFGRMSA